MYRGTKVPALAGERCTGKFAAIQKVLRVNGPHCVRKPVGADIKKEKSLTVRFRRVQVSRNLQ